MAPKRTIRGIRDKIPGGYVLGRTNSTGQGPVQLIKFTPNSQGGVGGGSSSGGVKSIAVEIFAGGLLTASETIGQIIAPAGLLLATGLPGAYAKAVVASTGAPVLTICKATAVGGVGAAIGTITFTSSATGVISFLADVSFVAGDRLLIVAPALADASLKDITILILGTL